PWYRYPLRSNTTSLIPEAIAFSAIFLPTFLEFSMFSFAFSPSSVVEVAAKVTPFRSSMICTYRPRLLLKTDNLGLSVVPLLFLRTPAFILSRLSLFLPAIVVCFYDALLIPNYLAAALPAFLRTYSPVKRIPFPLYGSTLRSD